MSLRVRLLIGILVLSAIGLLTLDVVSYRSLDSHLTERVDQQVDAAIVPLGFKLRQKAGIGPVLLPDLGQNGSSGFSPFDGNAIFGPSGSGAGSTGAETGPTGAVPTGAGGTPPPRGGGTDRAFNDALGALGRGNGIPPDGGGDSPPTQLPPGTYGQLRNAKGKVLANYEFTYGEDFDQPDLSGDIPAAAEGQQPEYVTVGSREGGSTDFRVTARTDAAGRTTIAAVPLNDKQETLNRLALIEAIVTASVLAALAILAWWVISIGLRPLDRMSRTADEISQGDLSQRIETTDPKTEVGRLGISLNAMLDQIEEAFEQRRASENRMRQFLADASHELRTPLASIRGYAELYRLGAIVPGDEVDRAMGRIESESGRMGDLVDGLLTLARLDDMPDPVREPIDLEPLVEQSRDDALATAPDRAISVDSSGDLEMEGDENQLRRLVSNLLRNAIVHTPDGSKIEVSLDGTGERVILKVRDHGDGLAAGTEEQVFERFWRDSESRDRDSGGAGIGLAVVAGIAATHGGTVKANNAEGGGAVFTVELPRNLASPEDSADSQVPPTAL